jgi:hypothetical protein
MSAQVSAQRIQIFTKGKSESHVIARLYVKRELGKRNLNVLLTDRANSVLVIVFFKASPRDFTVEGQN